MVRHPLEGAARLAARTATVPLINGGDGAHEHPTQTLTDLFLLQRKKGAIDGLTIGLLGDLKHGRTVHSLAPTLARLGATVVCIAPDQLRMPEPIIARVSHIASSEPEQVRDIDAVLSTLDAVYVTRVQTERFEDAGGHVDVDGTYAVDAELMARAPADMLVMHPLPRVDEINPEIDDDPRAVYFEQADGGVPVRMALISALLGLQDLPATDVTDRPLPTVEPAVDVRDECNNDRCVTNMEPNATPEFQASLGQTVCAYCERPVA